MTEFPNDIDTLKARVKELLEKNKHLEAENPELRQSQTTQQQRLSEQAMISTFR